MTLRPGEVVLIRIGFHQTGGGKLRPAVVLLDSGDDDFVAAPITSQLRDSFFDLPLQQDEIVRRLGKLAETDRVSLVDVLRRAYSRGS